MRGINKKGGKKVISYHPFASLKTFYSVTSREFAGEWYGGEVGCDSSGGGGQWYRGSGRAKVNSSGRRTKLKNCKDCFW